jgi:hypothetical protein
VHPKVPWGEAQPERPGRRPHTATWGVGMVDLTVCTWEPDADDGGELPEAGRRGGNVKHARWYSFHVGKNSCMYIYYFPCRSVI